MSPAPCLSTGGVERTTEPSFYGRRVHMIGIGGSGMCNVARVLLRQGAVVSGSDRAASEATLQLAAGGAKIATGRQAAANVPEAVDLGVISAAVPESNAELMELRRRGVEVINYAQLVGRLMLTKAGIAIAGTHGKSTTTAMTAHALATAGLDPTFVVGAEVRQLGGGSGVGMGPHFVVEACEFNRSFLHLRPRFAAILNIEEDHLDYYRDLDEIVGAFAEFGALVPAEGAVILNGDDATARRATESLNGRRQTFGLSVGCDWTARNVTVERGCHAFEVDYDGEALARVRLRLPGRHNMLNALASFALAYRAGAKAGQIAEALSSFAGCRRRMTLIGRGQGITVLDDYAHHPTEIRTTLHAVRAHYEPRRLWAIFQPHQHSRTRFLLEDFARSFSSADHILVPDIYFVRDSEAERTRIGAPDLVARIRANGGDALHLARFEEIAAHLHANLRDGDLVVTMGAGDVWKVADELAGALALDRA